MLLIVLLVMFVVVMMIWVLCLLGASPTIPATASGWLAFFACLILGIVVFLVGSGMTTRM